MSFEEIEHTADLLFRCRGKTIDELFSETASAMFSVMFEFRKDKGIKKEIELESDSYENLLVDFLSELIFLSETESLVFSSAKVKITDNSLRALISGEKYNNKIHSEGAEIKGISRSGAKIVNKDGIYQVDIIFDV